MGREGKWVDQAGPRRLAGRAAQDGNLYGDQLVPDPAHLDQS